MKTTCPNCKYTLEFDETPYESGTSVELECPICGQEIAVYIDKKEETVNTEENKDEENPEPHPSPYNPSERTTLTSVSEQTPPANNNPRQEEPTIVYVETESSNSYKWLFIALFVIGIAFIWYMSSSGKQSPTEDTADSTAVVDTIIEEDVVEELSEEEMITQFITEMYNQSKYNDYNFLYKHCTKKLIQKLKFDYEYDGDGLAVWDFRTISQDYKSESEKNYGVVDVVYDGNGWYTYSFYDGGWKGKNRIKASLIDGIVMMDGLEKIYDEYKEKLASEPETELAQIESTNSVTNIEFKGYIDDKYEIVVTLSQNGAILYGRYYYVRTMQKYGDNPSTYISLSGSIDDNGNANLKGQAKDIDEVWQGKFELDNFNRMTFHGTLRGANGQQFTFSITKSN